MTKRDLRLIQVVIIAVVSLAYAGFKNMPFLKEAAAKDELCLVERVVDGDTLKLSDNRRVRLIGVDTPEVHYSDKLVRDAKRTKRDIASIQEMGKKASDFTRKLCDGKKVRLEFDVEKRDRYKRLLAYVYLEDGTFINAKLIEEGYAQVMTIPPNVKYADYFLKLQKEAREGNKGLWGAPDGL